MNPREFCTVAGKFALRGEAAASRSAISRAYYSLFHVVLEFLEANQVSLPKCRPNCHVLIYRYLYNCKHKELQIVAGALNDLRAQRSEADYRLGNLDVESSKTACAVVERAQREIERFDRVVQEQAEADLALQGIRGYLASPAGRRCCYRF